MVTSELDTARNETTELSAQLAVETEASCRARLVTESLVAERERELLDDLEHDLESKKPIGLNPLSSALNVLEHRMQSGPNSYHAQQADRYLHDDIRTALFEGLIDYGHLSVTRSVWDERRNQFVNGSVGLLDVLMRGLDLRLPSAEYERRLTEIHEELLVGELFQAGWFKDHTLLTISLYPDNMTEHLAKSLGYRPDNHKYMLRWIEVDLAGRRSTRQLSMSGSEPALISELFARLGVIEQGARLTSTQILSTPLLLEKRRYPAGVADIARAIDTLGDQDRFLGGAPRNERYEDLELNSKLREERALSSINAIAQELIVVAERVRGGSLPLIQAQKSYARILETEIRAMCQIDVELAERCLGFEAAHLLEQARMYEEMGRQEEADKLREDAWNAAKPIFVCGMMISEENAKEGGHDCNEIKDGQIVKCPSCKRIVAAYVPNKESIFCTNSKCVLAPQFLRLFGEIFKAPAAKKAA